MLCSFFLVSFVVAACSAIGEPPQPVKTVGFSRPAIVQSVGKQATCVTGYVNVDATATQTKLLFTGPANTMGTVETFIELQQANSTIYARTNGGPTNVTGSFNISSKLCVPNEAKLLKNLTTLQFLTHGATLDSNYWEIAEGYSYIDAAAARGYATFSYDRLGVGKSEHPDPIQIVQAPIQVEIAHRLITLLRSGTLGGHLFKNVVGVGHSAGSTYTQGISAKYPKDFDAIILQGTSIEVTYVGASVASFDVIMANTDPSGRFDGIGNGYSTQGVNSPQSIQFPYFRYPYFDPKILELQYSQKETNTFGELLTLGGIATPAPGFTGPIDILLGQNDFVFCGGDCTYPTDQAAAVRPAIYPASATTSQSFLVPNTGHNINAHYSANVAFTQMLNFLEAHRI